MLEIGEKIELFAEKKFPGSGSLGKLANALGVSPSYLSKIKAGTDAGGKFYSKMQLLDCNLNWLLGDEKKHPMMFASTETDLTKIYPDLDIPFWKFTKDLESTIDLINETNTPHDQALNYSKIKIKVKYVIRYLLHLNKKQMEENNNLENELIQKVQELQKAYFINTNKSITYIEQKLDDVSIKTTGDFNHDHNQL